MIFVTKQSKKQSNSSVTIFKLPFHTLKTFDEKVINFKNNTIAKPINESIKQYQTCLSFFS